MKNGDRSATGFSCADDEQFYHGLTKREEFAMEAMGNLCTKLHSEDCAKQAVMHADALLAELERTS